MMFGVTPDHFIRNLSDRGAKISSAPKMATPISLFQSGKFPEQFRGASSSDSSHDSARSYSRRRGAGHIYMLLTDNTAYDSDFRRITGLANRLSQSQSKSYFATRTRRYSVL
jgi:hypothetical protein